MNLSNEFHPAPKPTKQRKEKPRWKGKAKIPKKRKKKLEVYKGRTIPSAKTRGQISKREYNEALKRHGEFCYVCGTTTNLEAHHVRFRSSQGRGVWRNIRFLCSEHHRGKYSPHQNLVLRRELEKLHESLYGPYYYCDKYDLFKMGLIPNTTDKEYEKFMSLEEKKAREFYEQNRN